MLPKSLFVRLVGALAVFGCTLLSTTSALWTAREEYPEYCSSPDEMNRRSIPPVQNLQQLENLELLQVVVTIRHGSRTPWERHDCWNGYLEDPVQSKWDCDLTTITAPPNIDDKATPFVFNKIYDALSDPMKNELGGTCQKGQLLMSGMEQEQKNGVHLRNAYLSTTESSMRLFEGTLYDERPYKNSTYFRSDDDQRVLMSGQVLLGAMFDVTDDSMIIVHTADKSVDILEPNPAICPLLASLETISKTSPEYDSLLNSDISKDMQNVLNHINATIDPMIDCMMTAICNDRPLPTILDDFQYVGDDSLFSQMEEFWTSYATLHYKDNNGMYSKTAMAPLWNDIINVIRSAKEAGDRESMKDNDIPKFFLISGHDLTILPMLISLGPQVWDKKWIPYASMFIIEVFTFSNYDPLFPSNKAFRLLYNGEVITNLMENCDAELCDLDTFLLQIESFATLEKNCNTPERETSMPTPTPTVTGSVETTSHSKLSSSNNNYFYGLSAMVTLVCSLASGLFTYIYMAKKLRDYSSLPSNNEASKALRDTEII